MKLDDHVHDKTSRIAAQWICDLIAEAGGEIPTDAMAYATLIAESSPHPASPLGITDLAKAECIRRGKLAEADAGFTCPPELRA